MAISSGSDATAPARPVAELTVRGMILGALMTAVFTAANVFFGLKAGLTFNSSIPATVISMALLRGFKSASVLENNIVQTIASSAGTLSSIIFVLPGLVMIGWWTGFPYWQSFAVCALGGVLGVMYSIPLRRALVTESDLPYPEGVACAEVLRVGARPGIDEEAPAEGRAGLLTVVAGSLVSAAFAVAIGTQLLAADIVKYARFGRSATGFDLGMSMALFGVGHLVGLWVGMAMLLGLAIGWGVAVPALTALHATPGLAQAAAEQVWSHDVRFIGAGAIGIAAVWTLLKLVAPVAGGLRSALAASRARRGGQGELLPIVERDIPINIVGLVCLASLVPIAWLLVGFARQGGLGATAWTLAIGGVIFVVLVGFLVSAVCGYMAGLIGSSNSPLSGVGILAVIGASLLLVAEAHGAAGPAAIHALTAFALFVTALVFAIAAIANDNLQDLKTGQLVGATPWKQQAALVFGVLMGAVVIPPILDLLNHAYGFVGAPGAVVGRALGRSDLRPRQGGDRRPDRLEPDRHGDRHRRGGHPAGRSTAPSRAPAPAAPGGGAGRLSAHGRDLDGGRRGGGRPLLRTPRRTARGGGAGQAAGRAARLRSDRRREPDRRRPRRPGGGASQPHAPGGGRRQLPGRGHSAEPRRLRRRPLPPLPLDRPHGRERRALDLIGRNSSAQRGGSQARTAAPPAATSHPTAPASPRAQPRWRGRGTRKSFFPGSCSAFAYG
jgi:putative OPT family oligopeptide transporter